MVEGAGEDQDDTGLGNDGDEGSIGGGDWIGGLEDKLVVGLTGGVGSDVAVLYGTGLEKGKLGSVEGGGVEPPKGGVDVRLLDQFGLFELLSIGQIR